ncbi:MAG: co-chaperone YbbN [Porticoccaceae bacterium]|nr:MAG: co-chaperone YbbN [Porticoccaceae bacterium]
MSERIVQITRENARRYLLEESSARPVLIDFWASWCAPCKALKPLLETLAEEYAGAFLLAEVDVDALPELAAQFGVRSVPTVVLMRDGRPVDAFQGAVPESALRAFLEPHLPAPWQAHLRRARELLAAGAAEQALELARQAVGESGGAAEASLVNAEAALALGRLAEARELLEGVPEGERDGVWEALAHRLAEREAAAEPAELRQLRERVAARPDDLEARFELAAALARADRVREALPLLYGILQVARDFREGEARRLLVELIGRLGKGHPLAVEYQKKLYNLLY